VVVVRDMFDATVSGYLYHKTGHECWLNSDGKPNPVPRGGNDWLRPLDWSRKSKVPLVVVQDDIRISPTTETTIRFPEYNLCQALNATNETIGIGIYLEFARNAFYQSAARLRSNKDDPTLFVCMEEMAEHPDKTEARIRSFIGATLTHHQKMKLVMHQRVVVSGGMVVVVITERDLPKPLGTPPIPNHYYGND